MRHAELVRVLGDDTTFGALLDSCLQPLKNHSSLDWSSTEAVGTMVPSQVKFLDLREEMNCFRTLLETLMNTQAKKKTRPGKSGTFQVVHESQI
jgi:hypothetical protein